MTRIDIDMHLLEYYLIGFELALKQHGETVNFSSNSVFRDQEYYKNKILKKATDEVDCDRWTKGDIGTCYIIDSVTRGLEQAGNLVNFNSVNHFKNVCADKPLEAENALYMLFCGSDDEKAFEEITDLFGGKYGLVSFLFFIHDPKRYTPVSPKELTSRMSRLGIDYRMEYRCTWENYKGFINIVNTIRIAMEEYYGLPVSLLDAHSFLWMVKYVDNYLAEKDINVEPLLNENRQRDTLAQVSVRIGQSSYRKDLIEYWDGRCSVTGCDEKQFLISSHIKPWRVCKENNEWIDKYNGLLLTPNLDKAFDRGHISFDDNGKIMISDRLSAENCRLLGISESMKMRKITDQHRKFLQYHREHIFNHFQNR